MAGIANYYVRTSLTSTTLSGALSAIDGDDLSASDIAIVITDDMAYHYSMAATNLTEASPLVIRPDTNATDVSWTLNGICAKSINIPFTPEPASPLDELSVLWVSDGTGSGDAGDVMAKVTVGATTKVITIVDWSAE